MWNKRVEMMYHFNFMGFTETWHLPFRNCSNLMKSSKMTLLIFNAELCQAGSDFERLLLFRFLNGWDFIFVCNWCSRSCPEIVSTFRHMCKCKYVSGTPSWGKLLSQLLLHLPFARASFPWQPFPRCCNHNGNGAFKWGRHLQGRRWQEKK